MDDKPAEAVRGKPDSSLVRAVRAVGDGEADAVVSAGNTGAMLAAEPAARSPPARACYRPGIAVVIPTAHGPSVLIDAGANAEARPEHLLQFGHMGSIFAEEVLGHRAPAGPTALDRRGAREGEPADPRRARAARRELAAVRRERRGADAARGRVGRDRVRRVHRQRCPEDPRGNDPQPACWRYGSEIESDHPRQARRPSDPARCARTCGLGSTRRRPAAATSSACAASSSSPTARARVWRSPTRSAWRHEASSTTSSPACEKLFRSAW